ncbi:hypothetical protein JNB63_10235 [Microbacterium trichothecenolyticum]|uniref:GDSL-type esterase/lipase family protein n=1 Tax=Microbacterium trichothecenolyticum TaxID=69370 RepID=UPI001C6ED4AD|nr:GDSL-type esterase/lipase family protein [Microbacterium trichothecenolyticum]MBW9120475.1 hypothetical protein [Microbacterium trichothecenolyticum]
MTVTTAQNQNGDIADPPARRPPRSRRRRALKIAVIVAVCLIAAFALVSVGALLYFGSDRPQAYEERVREIERTLGNPAPQGVVLLTGSSYFENWHTSESDLAPLDTVNVGIGGTKIGEQIALFDRLVVPFHPRALVVYAGSNDISGLPLLTKDPDTVVARVKEYVHLVHDRFPDLPVYYVAITEAPSRENVRDSIVRANTLLREWADEAGEMTFIDTAPELLTADGDIDASLFVEDRLHLNEQGYEKFSAVIRERLLADLG